MSVERSSRASGPLARDRVLDPGIGRVILHALAVLLLALAASQALGRLEPRAERLRPLVIAVQAPDRLRPVVRPAVPHRHPQARTISWTAV
jgi:hypothetical protein